MSNPVNFLVVLPDEEALAIAQFLKRVGWDQIRQSALDERETYLIQAGLEKVRESLADAGYAPR